MIVGVVQPGGDAAVVLRVRGAPGRAAEFQTVIDTGFNDWLVLPPGAIEALAARGVTRNRKTVARIMREEGIRSKVIRKFKVRTTDSDHTHPVASNVLDRRFTARRPDAAWLCDITYIPTGEGFLYLAGVLDLCSRRIVGWSMGGRGMRGCWGGYGWN